MGIYVQYDHIILSNVNHLFDIPPSINGNNDEYQNQYKPFLAAAPDYIVPNYFDSSVMIVQPNLALFQDMSHLIKKGDIGGFAVVDEDVEYGARGDKEKEDT